MIYCTFFVADRMLGVEVAEVQEVNRLSAMTAVPLAPNVIRGLINLRGQVVTAIDLRRILGLPDDDASPPTVNLVVSTDDGPVSLLVDQIGDVMHLDPAVMEAPPQQLEAGLRSLLRGIYKLEGRLMLILDTAEAASSVTIPSAEAVQ